ncbi:hypothetical protein [Roseateles saccharophilus]|uniref:DUF2933 domain-containing protein n=1 Tax=Roseateles saccharophilus TaxID=304 RepID=A0A4R3UV60_ROSSA|nr:hypothetical protein [Roseateles saccharophilus]MDG0833170.1 hypothetical protein [Roseateles saccharophilus]TCU94637.1 hypothetical protein EV671_101659 [Roseateles saccharophilus]
MRIDSSKAATWVLVAFAVVVLLLLLAEHHAHAWGPLLMLSIPVCLVLLYVATSNSESGASDDKVDRSTRNEEEGKHP